MPRASSKRPSAATTSLQGAVAPAAAAGMSLRQLAHELNSLLDGSMRCLAAVRSSLHAPERVTGSFDVDTSLVRIDAAMQHMAAVLAKAMRLTYEDSMPLVEIFRGPLSFAQLFERLTGLLQPQLDALEVSLVCKIAPECADIGAGPLAPALLNAVRNAAEACSTIIHPRRRIAVFVERNDQQVHITVTNPSAAKSPGHGLGLGVIMRIVRELGGEMTLASKADVVSLHLSVTLESLARHG